VRYTLYSEIMVGLQGMWKWLHISMWTRGNYLAIGLCYYNVTTFKV